jgi:hypothetical protein
MIQVVDALQRVEQIYKYIEGRKKRRRISERATSPETGQTAAYTLLFTEPALIKNRSQVFNPKNEKWVKRDDSSGQFLSVKKDGNPFARVVQTERVCAYDFPDDAA